MTVLNYGTIENPLMMTDAFSYELIRPGHTVYLRSGTYSANQWLNQLQGTVEQRITIKPYNNERVILVGGFNDAQSSYVDYIDLEFSSMRNSSGTYIQELAHDFVGAGNRVINCILHDSMGAGFWDNTFTFYGSISYNHGTIDNGTPYGHSLYTQNDNNPNRKTIKHSVFGLSANLGLHAYATNFPLERFDVIECVLLPANHLIGSQKADNDIRFINNHSGCELGYGTHDHTNLTCTGNILYSVGSIAIYYNKWLSGNVSNNVLVAGIPSGAQMDMLTYLPPVGTSTLVMDNNTYYSRSGKAACFSVDGIGWKTLAQWQAAYGFDLNSTITLDGSSPNDSTHVYPNEFADSSKRKALVVIWNWSGASSVSVDLTSISINAGSPMKVINCEDPLVDIVSTTMPADKIYSFAMTGHSVAQVAGWATRPTSFPTMGCFVLEST